MNKIEFKTAGVCAKSITFNIDDDGNIRDVVFIKGCQQLIRNI